jgi:hypothetical protein
MNPLIVIHLILSAVATLLGWWFGDPLIAQSIAAGAGVSLLNLLALTTVWPRIFAKKQVALALSVTVFKFAILGWILFEVVRQNYLSIGYFAVGMGLVTITVIVKGIHG